MAPPSSTPDGAQHGSRPVPVLRPAALDELLASEPCWRRYPLALSTEGALPLFELLERSLAATEREGEACAALRGRAVAWVEAAGRVLAKRTGEAPLGETLDAALRLLREDAADDAERQALDEESARVGPRLPRQGLCVALGSGLAFALHRDLLSRHRRPERERALGELRALADRLAAWIAADAGNEPAGTDGAGSLASALGASGAELLDIGALAERVGSRIRRGAKRLGPDRRERLEACLGTLRSFLEAAAREAPVVVVQAGRPPQGIPPRDVRFVESSGGLSAGIECFDELARGVVDVARAVRVTRLEIEGQYDPARHEPLLAAFGPRSLTPGDLRLLPTVVVRLPAERLAGSELPALSSLLQSWRPLHVLATVPPSRGAQEADAPARWAELATLGQVAVAHRRAVVLQATPARPEQLLRGLERMARSSRPAVALIADPGPGSAPDWERLVADLAGRVTPCFLYDPDAGESWADSFGMLDNPQPERSWPVVNPEPFTLAHAAVLDPALREQFRLLDGQPAADGELELARYLEAEESERRTKLPFIRVIDGDGQPRRAVVPRPLASECLECRRAWRAVQELGGAHSGHARRAAEAALRTESARAEQERARLELDHATELNRVRDEAVRGAMERLVRQLAGLETLPIAEAPPPAATPAAPAAEPEAAGPAAGATAAEVAAVPTVAYIDSELCTSCQECIQINGRMFRYNENKQAYIADPKAGTFEQLVRAAEKCPARCIHPGPPRDGDKTATPNLRARAARFA